MDINFNGFIMRMQQLCNADFIIGMRKIIAVRLK